MTKRQVFLECISAMLILLFLYASLSKFMAFHKYTGDMYNQPFPHAITPYIIWGVPLLEIAISVALIFEQTRLIGFYASLGLMMIFTIYTFAILLHFFPYIPCSCGGVIKKLTWGQHAGFNIFFVLLSLAGIFLQRNKFLKTTYITKNSLV